MPSITGLYLQLAWTLCITHAEGDGDCGIHNDAVPLEVSVLPESGGPHGSQLIAEGGQN